MTLTGVAADSRLAGGVAAVLLAVSAIAAHRLSAGAPDWV